MVEDGVLVVWGVKLTAKKIAIADDTTRTTAPTISNSLGFTILRPDMATKLPCQS